MKPFHLKNVSSVAQALDAAHTVVDNPQSGMSMSFLAGGTTLLDLMKLNVEQPNQVIDIHRLPLDQVEAHDSGGVIIGAMVRNSDLANDPLIKTHYPVLSQALLSGASAQLRNMATTGGNLLQRTRCIYFRHATNVSLVQVVLPLEVSIETSPFWGPASIVSRRTRQT
jgi:xanthine dehydrogenase YagS FAD-binding subunit